MKCREFEAAWVAQGEGNEADRPALTAHLGACSRCSEMVARLERLELALDALSDSASEPPPFLKSRIMARLEELRPRRRWWRRRRLVTSRRLLAVSVACLAFFAGLLTREVYRLNQRFAQNSSVRTVVLQYRGAEHSDVRLVGDFNRWGQEPGVVETEKSHGNWIFHLKLAPGRYQYAFVVDGKNWLPDPRAVGMIPDGFGGMNSILHVYGAGASPSRSL